MRLSELRQNRGNQPTYEAHDALTGDTQQHGTVRNVVQYYQPITAWLQGRPVKLIATGDVIGMSAAEKFIDENGKIDWASSEDFTVDDPQLLPASFDQRQRMTSQVSSRR